MKKLETVKSNRGHGEIDYVISISPLELVVLKKLVNNIKRLDPRGGGNRLKCAHVNIRKVIATLDQL